MSMRIVNIRQVVTPIGHGARTGPEMRELTIRTNSDIIIRDGMISEVVQAGSGHEEDVIVDARGGVVIPGLVDAHTHMAMCQSEASRTPPCEMTMEKAHPSEMWADLSHRMARNLRRVLRDGTTTVEIKCAQGIHDRDGLESLTLIQHLIRSLPVRLVPTFLAGCLGECERDEGVSLLIRETIPQIRRKHVAVFCDVLCGDEGFSVGEAQTILRAACGAGLRPKLHLDHAGGRTRMQLAATMEVASVDHVTFGSPKSLQALRDAAVVPVILPGQSLLEDRPYPDGRALIDAELAVAVATDHALMGEGFGSVWVATALAVKKSGLSPEEALTSITLNAAAALEMADRIGSVEPGKVADLVILDVEDYREAIGALGPAPVRAVIARGGVAYCASE